MKRLLLLPFILFSSLSFAASYEFTLGVMEDKPGEAATYQALVAYLAKQNISLQLKRYRYYTDAARNFEKKEMDGMFSGSGVAGVLMLKNLAKPLVRPENVAGWSTYRAVVLGSDKMGPITDPKTFFAGKKVALTALASSGEFYAKAIHIDPGSFIKVGNHGLAIEALENQKVDVAIVKNRVWEETKDKHPKVKKLSEDDEENPDMALMVSNGLTEARTKILKEALLKVESDSSPEAAELKKVMKMKRFIVTSEGDFKHTLELLQRAGVTKDFNF